MARDGNAFTLALTEFDNVEANLVKLERLWATMEKQIPAGISFGGTSGEYEKASRAFLHIRALMPSIDGFGLGAACWSLDEIAQSRLDAMELGEFSCEMSVERDIVAPGAELQEYRDRLERSRRALIRARLDELIGLVDSYLNEIKAGPSPDGTAPQWPDLTAAVAEIDRLLGTSVKRPPRWSDLRRHLSFGMEGDFTDIVTMDWPAVRPALHSAVYSDNDPIPVAVADLGELVRKRPTGPVPTALKWEVLNPADFERLLFCLISTTNGYENAKWLMHTSAPDRGRDLSVDRVIGDPLSGIIRQRVIVQAKHWLSRSVAVSDITTAREEVRAWEPPRVDRLIIATSGRFTADAVARVEADNQGRLYIEVQMWPESHLESLLASRPDLVAQFGLR